MRIHPPPYTDTSNYPHLPQLQAHEDRKSSSQGVAGDDDLLPLELPHLGVALVEHLM